MNWLPPTAEVTTAPFVTEIRCMSTPSGITTSILWGTPTGTLSGTNTSIRWVTITWIHWITPIPTACTYRTLIRIRPADRMADPTAGRMAVAAIMATADKAFRLKIEFFVISIVFHVSRASLARGAF